MLNNQPATRATRPLNPFPIYFESDHCHECMRVHMVEKTRSGKIICQGNMYHDAQKAHTHYARRLGKGYELVPYDRPAQMTLDWIMAAEIREPEYVDIDQDW